MVYTRTRGRTARGGGRAIPVAEIRLRGQQSRAQEVYEFLRDAIHRGDLLPNERLVEDQIAELASVSRTPVREAIRKLEVEGLVRQTRSGVVVVEVSVTELREFCQVREALEGMACRLAAESRSALDLAALESLGERYAAAVRERRDDDIVRLNRSFHESVWRMANNRHLMNELTELRSRIDGLRPTIETETQVRHREALAEHRDLMAALRDRDGDRAETLARDHFRKAMARRLERFADASQATALL